MNLGYSMKCIHCERGYIETVNLQETVNIQLYAVNLNVLGSDGVSPTI